MNSGRTEAPAVAVPTGPTRDHATYIGGADIAAVAGAHPYKTALSVWAEKTGRDHFEGNERTELGDHLERPTLELYGRRRSLALRFTGTLTHPDFDFLAATPDAVSTYPAIRDGVRGVQLKVVGTRQAQRWGEAEAGADGIPQEVYLQAQWEGWLLRKHDAPVEAHDVVALIGTDLPVYVIPLDLKLCANLEELAISFWREHVEIDRMPAVTSSDSADLISRFFSGKGEAETTPAIAELAAAYQAAREAETAAGKQKKDIGRALMAQLQTSNVEAFRGLGWKISYQERAGATDWKRVSAELRDLAIRAKILDGKAADAIEDQARRDGFRLLDVRAVKTSGRKR